MPPRRRDLFARLSLDYADHPKIATLSDGAFRAHVEMILYSRRYLTNGVIAKQIARRWPKQVLDELLSNDHANPSLSMTDSDDYLIHGFDEMQETREQVEAKRQVRADAGRRGGQARAKQIAKQTPSKRGSKIQAETETETETVTSAASDPDGFAEFWAVYPRKEVKRKAAQAFAAALKRADAQTIIRGAKAYAATPREAKYTAMATSWLNGDRWTDEPVSSTRPALTGGGWDRGLPVDPYGLKGGDQ